MTRIPRESREMRARLGLKPRVRLFTDRDDEVIRRGFDAGLTDDQIGEQLDRHGHTVGGRRRKLGLNRLERARGYTIDKKNPLTTKGALRLSAGMHHPQPELLPDAIRERDRAYLAPRTIGQELLGEPLPGRSHLDRMREQEASQGDLHKLSSRHPAWSPRAW